jgi:ribosomal protein L35
MSGQNGQDEAARLEQALTRISRAAARRFTATGHNTAANTAGTSHVVQTGTEAAAATMDSGTALRDAAPQVTNPASSLDTAEIAARLDSLIAELRALLGP